jgi:hypothetical protein
MIGRLELLALMNINTCHRERREWEKVDDICAAIEHGAAFFSSDRDMAVGLFLTLDGAYRMTAYPLLNDASA